MNITKMIAHNRKIEVLGKDYLKIYIANLDFICSLEDKEMRILFYMSKFLGYCNLITIASKFKKDMGVKLNMSLSTISKAIKGLKCKGVLCPINTPEIKKIYAKHTSDIYFTNMYFINPNIIGNSSFENLENLRDATNFS